MADDNIKSRQDWWSVFDYVQQQGLHSKPKLIANYIDYMLMKCLSMFEWKGLPESIPANMFELGLMKFGKLGIKKVGTDMYALFGNDGGKMTPYYFPKQMVIANPWVGNGGFSGTFEDDDDFVIFRNDPLRKGLLPLFFERASMVAECDITLVFALWKERMNNPLVSNNDTELDDVKEYIKKAVDGTEIVPIVSKAFIEGQKQAHFETTGTQAGYLKDIMELRQYYMASWYHDVGLQSNYNMKRESINKSESGMNEDALVPNVNTMLDTRKEDAEKVNKIFGTNWEVDLSSVWKQRIEMMKKEQEEKKDVSTETKTEGNDSESAD